MSEIINCPSCAAELDKKIKSTKHIVCEYCYSSLFFEDDSIQNLGVMAEVIDEPSILQLNIDFEYRGWNFVPIGRVRYDYGRGWWDEWYVMDTKGETKWISVDEGQIAIEEKEERIENSPIVFEDCFVGDRTPPVVVEIEPLDDANPPFLVRRASSATGITVDSYVRYVLVKIPGKDRLYPGQLRVKLS